MDKQYYKICTVKAMSQLMQECMNQGYEEKSIYTIFKYNQNGTNQIDYTIALFVDIDNKIEPVK